MPGIEKFNSSIFLFTLFSIPAIFSSSLITPPRPTSPFGASNWGLIRARIRASGNTLRAGRILVTDMKETSMVIKSGSKPTSSFFKQPGFYIILILVLLSFAAGTFWLSINKKRSKKKAGKKKAAKKKATKKKASRKKTGKKKAAKKRATKKPAVGTASE